MTEDIQPRADVAAAAFESQDPERRLLRGEVARQVHETIDQLPSRYAQALAWKYNDGLPVIEIARRLDLSEKAAESLLTRAREAFRARYRVASAADPTPGPVGRA